MKKYFILLALAALTHSASLVETVDTHIGTGGVGYGIASIPSGSQAPFGMVRLCPDTVALNDTWISFNHDGGYYYPDKHIRVFSHIHMDGAGVTDFGNIGFMPVSQKITDKLVSNYAFRSGFSHDKETAHAGYYSVYLEDHKVTAELTAT